MTESSPALENLYPDALAGMGERCPWYQHGHKLHQHGDLEGARDCFLRSVDVDFCNAYAWAAMAEVYDEAEEPEHALEAARQAVRSEPESPRWKVLQSGKAMSMGKSDEAAKCLDEAIQLKPDFASAWFHRALLHASQGKDQEALADLKQATTLNADFAMAATSYDDFERLFDHPEFPKLPVGENNPFAQLKRDSDSSSQPHSKA